MSNLEHGEFDGVKEADNKIPLGWLVFFIALILWGIWYIASFTPQISGWSFRGEFDRQMKAEKEARQKAEPAAAPANPYLSDKDALEQAEGIYEAQCRSCHGDDMKGGIGPSLKDALGYGDTPEEIYKTITKGTENGMPPFKDQIDSNGRLKLAAYILHERSEQERKK